MRRTRTRPASPRAWTGIGFSHAAREKFTDAIPAYRTAIRIFEAERENESAGRAWLGLSIAQSGALDHPAALESAQKVRTIAGLVKSEDLAWRADVRVGEVLRKLSRIDEARQSFQTRLPPIDRSGCRCADEPGGAPAARRQRERMDRPGARPRVPGGRAPGALAAVEARRAHIRRVQLGAFQRDITRGTTAEERAEEQAIVRELISTRAQVTAERNARKPDPARLARLEQQLASNLAKRADQQSRLYMRLPELEQWRGLSAVETDLTALVSRTPPAPLAPPAPVGEGGVKASGEGGPKPATEGGTVLVEYLVADDELLVVSIASRDAALASPTPAGRRRRACRAEACGRRRAGHRGHAGPVEAPRSGRKDRAGDTGRGPEGRRGVAQEGGAACHDPDCADCRETQGQGSHRGRA